MKSLVAAVALGFSLVGCASGGLAKFSSPVSAAAKIGRAEAEADVRAGRLTLRSYGFPTAWQPVYGRLLSERLGVHMRVVGGCLVDARLVSETAAYNEVMKAEIGRRFGPHALEEIEQEAIRTLQAQEVPAAASRASTQ